jgi:hypothetical protein
VTRKDTMPVVGNVSKLFCADGDCPSLHDVVIARDGVSFRQKKIFVGAYIDSRDFGSDFPSLFGRRGKEELNPPASSPSAQSP